MYSLFGSTREVGAPKASGTLSPQDRPQSSLQLADKTQSRGYRLWGWTLAITGRILTLAGAILGLLIPFSGSIGLRVVPGEIVLGLVVCIVGLKLELLGRRYTRRTLGTVDATDLLDPVIYLRPFNADMQTMELVEEASFWRAVVPPADQFWREILSCLWIIPSLLRLVVTVPRTEEEQLEYALRGIGPTVAVARPGENLPPAGFRRLKLDPTLWQEQVTALLRRARLVVLRCGAARDTGDGYWPTYHSDTVVGGLGWEIAAAVKEVPPAKLILLSPFNGIEYEDFRHKVKGIFPRGLPSWVESNPRIGTIRSLIWFDKEWTPGAAPLTWIDTAWRLDTRYPLAKNLRDKFQTILTTEQTAWGTASLTIKRVVASVLDCVFVMAVFFLPLILANKGSILDLEHKIQNSLLVAILLFSAAFICYEMFLEASGQMATFGKRLLGLLVTDSSSKRLSLVASLKRALFKLLLLPFTWIPIFTRTGLTLHDRLSRSVVTSRFIRNSEPQRFPFAASGSLISLATCTFLIWTVVVHLPQLTRASAISFPKGTHSVTINVDTENGWVLLPVEINGQKLSFLLGSMMAETMIDGRTAARLNLEKLPGKFKLTSSGAQQTDVEFTEKATIAIGDAKLRVQRLVISGLPNAMSTFHRIDGIIGYGLLNSSVVEIDYPMKRITLIESNSFKYLGGGESLPLALSKGWASVGATLLIHGFSPSHSDYWINTALKLPIGDPKCRSFAFTIPYFAGENAHKHAHLLETGQFESIKLGGIKLDDLGPDCCAKPAWPGSQIGAGLLKGFIVTFDYPHARLILERQH
jgi:uncharacterized RDD family membrane protein YckC